MSRTNPRDVDYPGQYGPPDRPLAADEIHGPPREVALDSLGLNHRRHHHTRVPHNTWLALAEELLLRLEQTPPRYALEIAVGDDGRLVSAQKSLSRYFRQFGYGYARVLVRTSPPRLYIARGKNWYKPGGMDLPAAEKAGEEGA